MKLYGIQIESWELEHYWDIVEEDINIKGGIAIYGNRNFSDIIPEDVNAIMDALEYDLMDALSEVDYSGNGRYKNKREAINDALYKISPLALTNKQVHDIEKIANEYYRADRRTEDRLLIEALNCLLGGHWEQRTIRGYSQGDWQEVIYDADKWDDDMMDYIEAVYMGTGTEWLLVETDKELNTKEEIEAVYDNGNGFCDYIAEDFHVKDALAKNYGYKVEDVKLFGITGQKTYTRYEYSEIA